MRLAGEERLDIYSEITSPMSIRPNSLITIDICSSQDVPFGRNTVPGRARTPFSKFICSYLNHCLRVSILGYLNLTQKKKVNFSIKPVSKVIYQKNMPASAVLPFGQPSKVLRHWHCCLENTPFISETCLT